MSAAAVVVAEEKSPTNCARHHEIHCGTAKPMSGFQRAWWVPLKHELVGGSMKNLAPIRPAPSGKCPEIRGAQRLLEGAHRSASDVLATREAVEEARKAGNATAKGRPAGYELDLLRAAIVFASSGLDASMKALLVHAGPVLILKEKSASQGRFLGELKGDLRNVDVNLRDAILSGPPDMRLVKYYLDGKANGSLLRTEDLKSRVRDTLGIPKTSITDARINSLRPFLMARNAIVHDMDYAAPTRLDSKARIHRSRSDVIRDCNRAFEIAADFIVATHKLLKST